MGKMIKPIIAIDPDIKKSGVAVLDNGYLNLFSLSFPKLVEQFRQMNVGHVERRILVEAGWMNEKSCWHQAQGKKAEKVAKDVGANHQVGRLIIEMAEYYGLNVEAVAPLKKCWSGKEGKIKHEELSRIEGIVVPADSNQEERDAALLAIVHSGMPIRMRR